MNKYKSSTYYADLREAYQRIEQIAEAGLFSIGDNDYINDPETIKLIQDITKCYELLNTMDLHYHTFND